MLLLFYRAATYSNRTVMSRKTVSSRLHNFICKIATSKLQKFLEAYLEAMIPDPQTVYIAVSALSGLLFAKLAPLLLVLQLYNLCKSYHSLILYHYRLQQEMQQHQ